MSSKHWAYPRLVAHRGAGTFAPENTLAAMRCGLDYGFDMVEFDVKLSQDNVLILMHDDDVTRTSTSLGLVAQMDYKQLQTLDVGQWHSAYYAGEPIPTLENIIRFIQENNMLCNIEIKPCPNREKITGQLVAKAVTKWFAKSDTLPLLSSFSAEALEAAYQEAPKIPRAFLCESYDASVKKIAKKLACVAINPDHQILTEKMIKTIHKDGFKICTWTVNDYQRAKQLQQWGCDVIITDELERLASLA
ncbi:glycerophosphodiester phosphodiesterase [Pelistega sp. NLN82]|uniref:Glycerophosphodiester phosphodiesterase n=1 Tax=Pelistega ratti TaxID=2652177 RepID=A0A6L9Y5C2_9BURK|nr:glycerophosphodiester phosphodiesterase [Pelistega ratti]NEN75415.1 glycerophosphodiester phosphodiesterase [Pelistega ratti]